MSDETYLETLWGASRAGLITWESVQQHQADMMPRCVNHPERSAPAIHDGVPICVDCFAAIVAARQEAA